jgi:hypothetical protein
MYLRVLYAFQYIMSYKKKNMEYLSGNTSVAELN